MNDVVTLNPNLGEVRHGSRQGSRQTKSQHPVYERLNYHVSLTSLNSNDSNRRPQIHELSFEWAINQFVFNDIRSPGFLLLAWNEYMQSWLAEITQLIQSNIKQMAFALKIKWNIWRDCFNFSHNYLASALLPPKYDKMGQVKSSSLEIPRWTSQGVFVWCKFPPV